MTARQASKEFYLDTGDGHKIHCAVYGPSHGTPLLLIHGGAGHTFDIDRLNIPESRRVIVMHQRGMGQSLPAGETRNNTIAANIEDIERVRQHLKIPRWDIFSWSFGAVYMAAYAFDHPQRCTSLTAYAPYFGSDEDYQVITQKDAQAASAYYAFHDSHTGKGIAASAFAKAADPDYNKRFSAYLAVCNLAAAAPVTERALLGTRSLQEWKLLFAVRQAHAALDHELFTRHDRFLEKKAVPVTCPVTLIYGEKDVWAAPNGYASRLFPSHRSHIVAGAGHDVHEAGISFDFSRPRGRRLPSATPQ